jgi:HptB-dependent secretion and biofilm anti anti-sigma factor
MSVKQTVNHEKSLTNIVVKGNFTFDSHKDFLNAYTTAPDKSSIVINLSDVDYMDSAALGMLLQLKEFSEKRKTSIRVINSKNENVRSIFDIVDFHNVLNISDR